ncbi:P-loop containing nucleoside triphosphate hydrolase protein [Sanghuangporus baumii]|uniref:P-loop containing nucleoside triphosphate hydrolase protein n=1 Tax=Sanghuangporus baumii TaxID=108892 RepID=A0A9Q5NA94_SANBA|nr:P-loop containing nucleoside triphosphate hydrolase protein [Sanghuangporus baumii]
MDELAQDLANYLIDRLKDLSSRIDNFSRLLVGISGIPASGKSTLAELVVNKVNEAAHNSDPSFPGPGILIGLDGWHLTRAQLNAMPDPKLAHDRRGAHWTFDGNGYVAFVKSIRGRLSTDLANQRVIRAPIFDHATKDPEPDTVVVLPAHRLVVIEGLYTFLSIDPWVRAGELLDERWFIDIDIEEATRRLVKRHVLTGVAKDVKEALWRAETSDMPNGLFVMEKMLEPTRRIKSPNDPLFRNAVEHEPE